MHTSLTARELLESPRVDEPDSVENFTGQNLELWRLQNERFGELAVTSVEHLQFRQGECHRLEASSVRLHLQVDELFEVVEFLEVQVGHVV